MDDLSNKITALVECMILWDHLAKTGGRSKRIAIKYLHRRNKLAQSAYNAGCPLCEQYCYKQSSPNCSECPWPKNAGYGIFHRCLKSAAYRTWRNANNVSDRNFGAKMMVRLTQAMINKL